MFFPQGRTVSLRPRFSNPKRKVLSHRDSFFHLPTTLAQNDPFLRRLYGVVSYYLDDHPYPSTREEFERRTFEIKQNVRDLNLRPDQQTFLERLMSETGVTLVNFSSKLNFLLCVFLLG